MTAAPYFNQHVADQQRVTATDGNWSLCYAQQIRVLEAFIEHGCTVLDIGCGPSLPYSTRGIYVIGLDPSAEALSRNTDVDERVVGSAVEIPYPDNSLSLVVAFYSLHHMTTQTYGGSRIRAERAIAEMQRVLNSDGTLLIFEMRPHRWASWLQAHCWDLAKAVLGDGLDACFLDDLTGFEVQTFAAPWYTLIAPILSLPWLKIPRILWPFQPVVYRWSPGSLPSICGTSWEFGGY